jgi:hypothetical protein
MSLSFGANYPSWPIVFVGGYETALKTLFEFLRLNLTNGEHGIGPKTLVCVASGVFLMLLRL